MSQETAPKIITTPQTAKANEERKIKETIELSEQEEKTAFEGFKLFMESHNVVMETITTESDVRGVLQKQINFISKRRMKMQ